MWETDYVLFENRMPELPLLSNYICSFETASGIIITPKDFDTLENSKSHVCVVLTSTGELLCRTIGVNEMEVPIRFEEEEAATLVLRIFPNGPSTRIPLEGGRVCAVTETWEVSDQKMLAQIAKPLPFGFLVRVHDSQAFLPNSFVPWESRRNPDALVEKVFECEVYSFDGKHPPAIKPIGPFFTFEDYYGQVRNNH